MCVENLKRFDVRGYHCNYASLLLALEFCGAENAQLAEDFIPQHRQKTESYVVVGILLEITQNSAKHAAAYRKSDYPSVRQRYLFSECFCYACRTENRHPHCGDKAETAVQHCQ